MSKKQIKIMVTPQLHESLQAEADAMGMRLATYIAWLLTRRATEGKKTTNRRSKQEVQQSQQELQRLMEIF
jgi:predicted glycosyl hydrolase (DUF1957 family)